MHKNGVVLVTGGTGRLGSSLKVAFPDALFPTRAELNMLSADSIRAFVKKNRPSVIIHAAALVGIRICEDDEKLCWKTNVEGTYNLIKACLEFCSDVRFVYISSPCIFDGNRGMYKEKDVPMPKNLYGVSKVAAEQICRFLKNHLVIRANFVPKAPWIYEGAFTDRFGTYLFAKDVAFGLKELLDANMTGTVHLVGDKTMSMYELALMCGSSPKKITMQDYSGPPLTINMTLDTDRWKKYTIGFAK